MTTPPEPPAEPAPPLAESDRPRVSPRGLVRQAHLQNAAEPIVAPNEYGAFPDSRRHAGWPVVADANVLLRDVSKACRQRRRTILVTAANSGTVRLFCAQHVLDEVAEHAVEFATGRGVDPAMFLRLWEAEYLPLLHLVDPADGLLAPDEAERIALLDHGPPARYDPDDVPSATLALQLGAFFLTTDKKPLWAVYGPGVDLARHKEWLDILGAAGDSGELGELMNMVTGGSELAVRAGYAAVKWVWNNISPVAVVGLAAVATYSLWKASPATRRRLLNGARSVGEFVGELYLEHQTSSQKFTSMMAQIPTWASLADTVPAEQVRARACMYTLARSPMPDRSAAELAEDLPDLPVSTSEATVRATLRRHACFHEVYQGRWQIGYPAREGWQSPIIQIQRGELDPPEN
jgi:predicted nucleic acid-binding protein